MPATGVAVALLTFSSSPAAAQPGFQASLSFGSFDIGTGHDSVFESGLEARLEENAFSFLPDHWRLRPIAGLSANSDAGFWVYLGVRRDFELSRGWVLGPSISGVYYQPGRGKTLGLGFEFRSALELSYRVKNACLVGVTILHLSNGGLSEQNPGGESILLSVTVPGH